MNGPEIHSRRFFDPRLCRNERRRANILACLLFCSVLSYVLISRHVFSVTEIVGRSMEPTLLNGERSIINRCIYHLQPPQRGEIVAVRLPGDETLSVKRVVAGPSERIQVTDGAVLVNAKRLWEPYLPRGVRTSPGGLSAGEYLVAKDCYFLLGDNRTHSTDSRYVGAVPRDRIVGRIAILGQAERSSILPSAF